MSVIICHPESDCVFVAPEFTQEYAENLCHVIDPTHLPAGTEIQVGVPGRVSVVRADFDFETYSEAGYEIDAATGKVRGLGSGGKGGLGVVGTPVYVEHPSFEVLCLYYDLKDGRGRRAWIPGGPEPLDLLDYVRNGGEVEAFNITFEWWVWNLYAVRRFGWPPLPLEQCFCAMAKAKRFSLPASLAKLAAVLGTPGKDPRGDALIRKLTRPHTPTKANPSGRWTPLNAWPDFQALYNYCGQDIVAEAHASARVPDLTPYERETWLLDQKINARGVQVDVEALDAALDLLGQIERKYTAELQALTGGAVNSVSQVAALGRWLCADKPTERGIDPRTFAELLNDDEPAEGSVGMDKKTVAELLDGKLPPLAKRALEIRVTLGAANVKKLRTLKLQLSSDGRLRDQYRYSTANTGRWAAGGVQLQNITAKGPKCAQCESCGGVFGQHNQEIACPRCGSFMHHALGDWTIDGVEWAIKDVLTRDLDLIERIWGNPITVLCGILRGLFIAREGYKLVCVDFSAIEAVAAACLARCQWRIDVFSGHGKIYEQSAANATGIPFEEILDYKKRTGQHHPARKTIGKVRELAGGYGGWVGAWKNFGAGEFMTDDEIKADVLKWRDESPEIVEMWGSQFRHVGPGKWDYVPELFGLEGMAIAAILNPGKCYSHNDVAYGVWDDVLYCRLPSGRFLHYHRPRLVDAVDKLNRGPCYQITFEGYNSNSAKGPVGWFRLETYGGRLFENCIAEDTLVLTRRGWVKIQNVRASDYVHDGVDWFGHGGLLYKNEQACLSIDGVFMTPDHEVLTNDGWKKAETSPRPYRPEIRRADRLGGVSKRWPEKLLDVFVQLRQSLREMRARRNQRRQEGPSTELRVFNAQAAVGWPHYARNEPQPDLCGVPLNGRPLHPADSSSVGELRRTRHNGVPGVGRELRELLARYGCHIPPRPATGPQGQRRGVLAGELPLGNVQDERKQQTVQSYRRDAARPDDGVATGRRDGNRENDAALPPGERLDDAGLDSAPFATETRRVYDIVNAGPRRRFVVLGENGPFIVHNCVQAASCDLQADALLRFERAGYSIVMHTHDEGVAEVPIDFGSVEEMARIASERPAWASWWPIRAAGWQHKRYQKD
jgi:DNA polymerase